MITLGKFINKAFQALCDMGQEETLEAAVAKVHGDDDLQQQGPGEVDLDSLSEEKLEQLADSMTCYVNHDEAKCRDSLINLRGCRTTNNVDMAKANKAINALRARLKLLKRKSSSSRWAAQTEQQQQLREQQQQQQQQQQLQGSAAAGTALAGGSRAGYFTDHQTPKRVAPPHGKNSERQARGVQQGQRPKVLVLDSIMQLAGKPQQTAQQAAAGRKPGPQPSRPASVGPHFSSGMPGQYGPWPLQQAQHQQQQHQQHQQHQQNLAKGLIYQPQRLAGLQPAPRTAQQQHQQQGRLTQLQLTPSQPGVAGLVKPAHTWGARASRGSQQQAAAVCDQCKKPAAVARVVLGGMHMCQQCEREQLAMLETARSQGIKAAPLRADKLPARPEGTAARAAAAPRAAGARRRGKAQGSEDAPITIDSDDEQEQQQQGAGAAAAAAGDVEHMTLSSDGEGPSGGGRRRRSSRISLVDADPGTAARFAGLHMVYPPEGGKGAVVVTPDDLARLDDGEFLNDTIIDFYTKWVELQLASSSPQAAGRFHFFNSFFYKKLSEAGSEPKGRSPGRPELARRAHGRVKTWTKGVDIFAKDFLLVPIHDALHWSLAIVCHPALFAQRLQQAAEQAAVPAAEAAGAAALARAAGGGSAAEPAAAAGAAAAAGGAGVEAQPVIIHLDSMAGGHTTATIFNYLRYFLVQEWLAQQRRARAAAAAAAAAEGAAAAAAEGAAAAGEERSPAPEQQPDLQEPACAFDAKLLSSCKVSALPKQDNHCDCGLFVLAYLEYFVHADPPALSPEAVRNAKVELSPVEPRLLREGWFHPEVAYSLRGHLRHMLLDLMLQQAPDKELPGVVAAVADTAQYRDQLEVHRKDVEQRGAEVNPVFGYVPPGEYARVRQQLAQYQQRQQEANAARKAAAAAERRARKSGAERKRDELRQQQQEQQQQQHDAAAGHGAEPGAGGPFAVDYTSLDEQPLAAHAVPQEQQHTLADQPQPEQRRPQHIVFSVSDDEQGDDAVAASPAATTAAGDAAAGRSAAAGGTPAAGGGCRPDSAGWQGDDEGDDDFVKHRKRRSGGGQQQQAKRIKPSPLQQQQQHHSQQRQQQQQHMLHPEQEEDPVQGYEQQGQQQGQRPSRRLLRTEEVQQQRRQRSLPPDDAGGSGVSSDSSGSLGRADGAAAARRQEQQQQWRQAAPTPTPAAAVEDEADDMSVDEPPLQQAGPAAAPAAELAAQPAACTPHTRAAAAAAAANTVDLCCCDEEDAAQPPQPSSKRPRTQQQPRQADDVSDSDWESCEGGDDAAQHAEPSRQPAALLPQQQQQQHSRQPGRQQQVGKQPDEAAFALLLPCLREDITSMERMWSLLCGEFEHYGADLALVVRSGAVPAEHQGVMLDMLREELGRRPPKRLLPYLLEKVQLLAVEATAHAAVAARTASAWQQLGLQQPQAQPAAAARRPGSSGKNGSNRTGSAAKRGSRSRAAPAGGAAGGGRGQRKLREVLPLGATLEFAGTVAPATIASSVNALLERVGEEHAGSGSDYAGSSSEHGGSSEAGGCTEQDGPSAELGDLRLGSQDVLALLPPQQQQQQVDVEVVDFTNDSDAEEQQQQPVAPSPWPVTGAAAQQAQRASAAAQQQLIKGRVADMLGSNDGDHPAGVASWQQQQQHRGRHEQQPQQQQQQSIRQQQQQQLMHPLTNATAVGFSPALQEFWNSSGMQAGQMPGSITAAGRQQQQPAPLPPGVMPYGGSDSVAGDSRQLRQDSRPTESMATGATDEHEDDALADSDWRGVHEEDVTSPARPAPPLAAAAAAPLPPSPAGAGGVTAHGSSSQQPTAAAAALLASQMRATRSSCPQQRAPAAGRLPQGNPALA